MPYNAAHNQHGPVFVLKGEHKGRIGYLDDTGGGRNGLAGIIYFGDPLLAHSYYTIPMGHLEAPNTQQIIKRHNELLELVSPYYAGARMDAERRASFLEELSFVIELLNERTIDALFKTTPRGAKIFISHSSVDKLFVRKLAVDLSSIGHQPWLDEWDILAGESIPARIGEGIEDADFVIVVLSSVAVRSKWVENEWHAKYWTEANQKDVLVIPVVIEDCEVPVLLRSKKYVDFREDYTEAIQLLSKSVGKLLEKKNDSETFQVASQVKKATRRPKDKS